ncbi:MAG: STAS domain-containing protein [Solirubrobacteraceae bacterium]
MQIETQTRNGATVLTATGELDGGSSLLLRAAAEEACTSPGAELVLDLRGLTFMDSSGVRALVQIADRFRDTGATVRLIVNRKLAQKFALTGIGEAIPWTEEAPEQPGEG